MFSYLILLVSLTFCNRVQSDFYKQPDVKEVQALVRNWSNTLGSALYELSMTMTRKAKIVESFKPLRDKIYYANDVNLRNNITETLKRFMLKKEAAVKNIAEYAEFLAYHRKNSEIKVDGPFDYYNADNITSTESTEERRQELSEELEEAQCAWWCTQKNLEPLPPNSYKTKTILDLFDNIHCDCDDLPDRERPRRNEYFRELPLETHPLYGNTEVNLNLSVVKVVTNIYHRDQNVLQGVRWSEPLDLVFKDNLKNDPDLKFQYFASPYGYMRHFPAIKWSKEQYDVTYDPRLRSWYTEAMTSPKDVIILFDRSGSVFKRKKNIAGHIVNNILDTLNDNDFVNIYTFTNKTEPLVSCFADTLVQANEENLRLLRESLEISEPKFAADVRLGLEKAFQILEKFRTEKDTSSQCNQAIMMITEAVYYDAKDIFKKYNWDHNITVRVFTYQLETDEDDARVLEFMACANRGYFANISLMEEVREKVLPYLNVMSRPVNYNYMAKRDHRVVVWSYLYIDLADRRYTNWLWKKIEGNRQRAVFLDHAKREFMRLNKVLTSESHFLLQESHSYEEYNKERTFDYMTTLSLPVYGRREEDVELVGVAALDVPIKLIKSLIPHHTLGVNAYAFIITNNGYILMHPGHRPEFENIPKPTFNRVDLLEVEILDDTSEPRLFSPDIIELRKNMIKSGAGTMTLPVKFALDDMKRIILSERTYFYSDIGPFKLGIALPENYGLMMVNISQVTLDFGRGLLFTKNWAVHPDWIYCESSGKGPKDDVLQCLKNRKLESHPLFWSLLFDANATIWFENAINKEKKFVKTYLVDNVFMATHSGLTRWKTFEYQVKGQTYEDKGEREGLWGNKSIDEDWYKRAVEENFHIKEDTFIYSVPFETSGYEYDNMITSTSAIYINDANGIKTPLAVAGLQFNYRTTNDLYKNITTWCDSRNRTCYTCDSNHLTCFILDNNAYVILSDEIEHTGRYIGDIKPEIMYHLVQNKVYKEIRMFDYQAICQKPLQKKTKNAASAAVSILRNFVENLLHVTDWALATILFLITSVAGGPKYQSTKNETLAYERLEINKTVPTPCDQQMYLFTLNDNFSPIGHSNRTLCSWVYIVQRIPHSNLLFMAVNSKCELGGISSYRSPTPVEINYNETLACYIATHNNFSTRIYMNCHNRHHKEENLNEKDKFYCGHTWKP